MEANFTPEHRLVLITGATGHVGGRLVKTLRSHSVVLRCVARRPENLRERMEPGVAVVGGDVMDRKSLPGLAFADSVGIWFASLATMAGFRRASIPAAWLFKPCLAWVPFATALN